MLLNKAIQNVDYGFSSRLQSSSSPRWDAFVLSCDIGTK
jgi:hypothetical protein